jgi:hypothetical protein
MENKQEWWVEEIKSKFFFRDGLLCFRMAERPGAYREATTQDIYNFIKEILQEQEKELCEQIERAHMAGYHSCCGRDASYSEARNYRESILLLPINK